MKMTVSPSTRRDKKYMATFSDGTTTHFGAKGYGDYTIYSTRNAALARRKRAQYIARHGATESWTDPTAASTLARYLLWERPTLAGAIKAYKKRFTLH